MNKRLKNDFKMGVLLSTMIVPFPFLGLFSAPWWAWAIWIGWLALLGYANRPRRRRKAKFQHYEIDKELIKDLEDIA